MVFVDTLGRALSCCNQLLRSDISGWDTKCWIISWYTSRLMWKKSALQLFTRTYHTIPLFFGMESWFAKFAGIFTWPHMIIVRINKTCQMKTCFIAEEACIENRMTVMYKIQESLAELHTFRFIGFLQFLQYGNLIGKTMFRMVRYVEVCVKPAYCAIQRIRIDIVVISMKAFPNLFLLFWYHHCRPITPSVIVYTVCLVKLVDYMFNWTIWQHALATIFRQKFFWHFFIRLWDVIDTNDEHLLFYGKLHFHFW